MFSGKIYMKANPPAVFNRAKYNLTYKSKIYINNATCIFFYKKPSKWFNSKTFFPLENYFSYILNVNV